MIIIDWVTAVKGDPAADVARTDYILRYASKEDSSKIEAFLLKILQLFAANVNNHFSRKSVMIFAVVSESTYSLSGIS